MSLRFRLAAIASATVLAAGMGMAVAAPAFANGQHNPLCADNTTDGQQCALFVGDNTYISTASIALNATDFNAPGNGSTGQISLYLSGTPGYCMQIMPSVVLRSVHNIIYLKPCRANADEEWTAHRVNGSVTWYSNAATGLCLNDVYYDQFLNAAACDNGANVNQQFSSG